VEQNITSFDKLRDAIYKKKINKLLGSDSGVKNKRMAVAYSESCNEVKLCEVLNSKENPLLKRHQIIMKYANKVNLFEKYENIYDAIFAEGIEGLYKNVILV
jgi:hypothetical protein